MDRFVIHRSSSIEDPKPRRRPPWKKVLAELEGQYSVKFRRQACALMLESYTQIGSFPHLYHIGEAICPTHDSRILNAMRDEIIFEEAPIRREGISALELDSKGIYLASVTKSGCLTVHDFEALYCLSNGLSTCSSEDESKHLIHLNTNQQIDVVRWNLTNQDEVACTSVLSNEIRIYDIGYISSEPTEVLKKRPTVNVNGQGVPKGLSDIAFSSTDESRLLASDIYGVISIWDRRTGSFPCVELTTDANSPLNSIQLNVENQIVFGAGKHGIIYAWDLRGGKSSAAFQSHKVVYHPPLTFMKLAPILENIRALKEQTVISSREIHSIDLNPSCPHQLAFHLDNGWSGVFDTNTTQVTHIHCPPPAWLDGTCWSAPYSRKQAWLSTCSIYAVGSSYKNGIHLLDFFPDSIAACHVDFEMFGERPDMRNVFIPLSARVTACTSHPLNGTIVVGTKESSLLVISQKHQSFHTDPDDQTVEAKEEIDTSLKSFQLQREHVSHVD